MQTPSLRYLVYSCADPDGICAPGTWWLFGGTSGSAPSFAGIMAMIVQSAGGQRQGNFNSELYRLGNAQYSGTGDADAVFNDITSGNNGFGSRFPGHSCTVGYDLVTGLGSVNAANLLLAFQGTRTATHFAVSAPSSATAGTALSFTVTALDAGNHTVTGYSGTVD